MRLLQDKVVFITGSSRGIGREIALKFAFSGNTLIDEDFLRDENFLISRTMRLIRASNLPLTF